MEVSRVINRHNVGGGEVVEVLVELRNGRVFAVQTKPVKYGTVSRRTLLYGSYDAYHAARDAGQLQWSPWR